MQNDGAKNVGAKFVQILALAHIDGRGLVWCVNVLFPGQSTRTVFVLSCVRL